MRANVYVPGMSIKDDVARAVTPEERQAFSVVDDIPDMAPVTEAELDAVEAFLGPLVRALLDGCLPEKDTGQEEEKGFKSAPSRLRAPT